MSEATKSEATKSEVLESKATMDLDLKVDFQTLASMTVTRVEGVCNGLRTKIEAAIADLGRRHDELTEALAETGERVWKNVAVRRETQAAATALTAAAAASEAAGLDNDLDNTKPTFAAEIASGEVDIAKQVVLVVERIAVLWPASVRRGYGHNKDVLSVRRSVPFTPPMTQLVRALSEVSACKAKMDRWLAVICQILASEHRLSRLTQNAMVEAHLNGKLERTSDIENAIKAAVDAALGGLPGTVAAGEKLAAEARQMLPAPVTAKKTAKRKTWRSR